MAPSEQTRLLQQATLLTAAGHSLPEELQDALREWLEDQDDEAAALLHEQAMHGGTVELIDLASVCKQRGWPVGGLHSPAHVRCRQTTRRPSR